MTRKKQTIPAVGIRLEDVLAQKQVMVGSSPDTAIRIQELETRVAELTSENRRLTEALARQQAEHGPTIPDGLDVPALFHQAVEQMKSGAFLPAAGYLQTVLILEPGHIGARLNLAVVYHELGQTQGAVGILKTVLLDDPNNVIAQENLNLLSSIQGTEHP